MPSVVRALSRFALATSFVVAAGCKVVGTGPATIAEVEVIRPPVKLSDKGVVLAERLSAGGVVSAEPGGRAWVRHDGSARALLDGGAKITVAEDGFGIDAGRAWIEVAPGAHIAVTAGKISVDAAGARLEARRAGEGLTLYVASGEVAFRLPGGTSGTVRAGENAELSSGGAGAKVSAAKLWDDWTGGLAWPDPGRGGDRAKGQGEVGARRPGSLGEARFPLAITRLEVRTTIEDDLATTRVIETFFNPASDTLEGLYRLHVPEGAILQRFAIDRNGRWADGFVKERETARAQYQAQVYEGSTKDPALLEWDAPGSYRARLYPLPPGASRRILVEYTEWLTPRAGERTFRYPLSAGPGADAPLVQELDIEVDAAKSGATSVRAGLDARIEGLKAQLERTDYRPRADFVVDLVDKQRSATEARGYRSPHQLVARARAAIASEDDYYLVRAVPLPASAQSERPPLDLVILTDISAATDATHLQLARTTVEALLRHLDDKDRVAIAGADLDLHPPGGGGKSGGDKAPSLMPAARVELDRVLDALARQGTGGATDLGATLTQAAALLTADPARRGAVVYVGDAAPTVGELDLKTLRERLDRLPAPLRLYGVAIGDDSDLALLAGLSDGGGLAMRVGDRSAAAASSLRILSHATRRVLSRVTVDAGAGLDRTYPRRPMTVVEGEAIELLARVRTKVPEQVTLVGLLDGKPWKQSFTSPVRRIDGDDLRLRWSSERLNQLLADGASAEEVAELGTRQNLITPFTSYYVPSADELAVLEETTKAELAAGLGLALFGCSMDRSAPVASEARPVSVATSPPVQRAPADPASNAAPGSVDDRRARLTNRVGQIAGLRIVGAGPQNQEKEEAAKDEAPPPAAEAAAAAPSAPAAVRPAAKAVLGADAQNAMGGLVGDSVGAGGLGLRGTGAGGGGTGDGTIGLGNIGTGSGYGAGGGKGGTRAERHGAMAGPAKPQPSMRWDGNSDGRRDKAKKVAANEKRPDDRFHATFEEFDSAEPTGDGGGRDRASTGADYEQNLDDSDDLIVRIDILRHRPKHCSAASQQALSDRVDLWRERLSQHRGVDGVLEVWQDASQRCELKMWADRRALLRAMLGYVGGAPQMVALYQRLSDDESVADFLRKALMGAAKTPADLLVISNGLGLSQDVQWTLVEELVAKAKTPEERVRVLQQLEKRWAGDLRLKLKMMDALEALGRKEEARRVADVVRAAPNADVQARTAVGELLSRLGDLSAARRAFSEIVEFAPQDPVARRRLGDLYRAHGWFDEALRQYETLAALTPGEGAVLLLQAAAAAGAGRIDEALRLEQRVSGATEAGAETGIARVAVWWSTLRLALLREDARGKHDDEELAKLLGRTRRANVIHDARPLQVFLTWAHPEADCELYAQLPGAPMQPAFDVAPEFGIASVDSREPLAGPTAIEVRRPPGAANTGLRYGAELVVILDEGQKSEHLVRTPIEIGPGTDVLRFKLDGGKVEVLQ